MSASLAPVQQVVADALRLPKEQVTEEASMETLPEWDSFGHLNILVALHKRFEGRTKEIPGLAKATSVKKLAELIRGKGLL